MIITKSTSPALEKEMIQIAGIRCACHLAKRIHPQDQILLLCGPGQHGQLGQVIAKALIDWEYALKIVFTDPNDISSNQTKAIAPFLLSLDDFLSRIDSFDVLIDCVCGISFVKPLEPSLRSLFKAINESALTVYSIDLNSGLEADSAKADPYALHSSITFVLGARKPAHLLQRDHQLFNQLEIVELGWDFGHTDFIEMDPMRCQAMLPKKAIDSYKNQNGQCLGIAGSKSMAGAAILSFKAALASGIGYLHGLIDETIYPQIISACPSAVCHFLNQSEFRNLLVHADAVFAGPGMNRCTDLNSVMEILLENCTVPLILDAAALRWLSDHPESFFTASAKLICTPHLGEFSGLIKKSIPEIQQNKLNFAREFAKQHHCLLVLKGPHTIVADEDGRCYINQTGNPKLAKAGSGDVLCGLIGGFAAQHLDPFDACVLAVYLHGLAADRSPRSEWSFLPEELPEELRKILDTMSS